MAATWHTLIIRVHKEQQKEEFKHLTNLIGALPAARDLELNIQQRTFTAQKDASLTLRQNLHHLCYNDPSIVWCSLRGPRFTHYLIKG